MVSFGDSGIKESVVMSECELGNPEKKFNLDISFGGSDCIVISQNVKKSLINRFRFWMLCQFFPFKIERWD